MILILFPLIINVFLLKLCLCSPGRSSSRAAVTVRSCVGGCALGIQQDMMWRRCELTFSRGAQEELLITHALCSPAVSPVSPHLCLSVSLSVCLCLSAALFPSPPPPPRLCLFISWCVWSAWCKYRGPPVNASVVLGYLFGYHSPPCVFLCSFNLFICSSCFQSTEETSDLSVQL